MQSPRALSSWNIAAVRLFLARQRYANSAFVPSRRGALNRWWFNVGPPSQTVARHWTSNGSTSRVCGLRLDRGIQWLRRGPSGRVTFLRTWLQDTSVPDPEIAPPLLTRRYGILNYCSTLERTNKMHSQKKLAIKFSLMLCLTKKKVNLLYSKIKRRSTSFFGIVSVKMLIKGNG